MRCGSLRHAARRRRCGRWAYAAADGSSAARHRHVCQGGKGEGRCDKVRTGRSRRRSWGQHARRPSTRRAKQSLAVWPCTAPIRALINRRAPPPRSCAVRGAHAVARGQSPYFSLCTTDGTICPMSCDYPMPSRFVMYRMPDADWPIAMSHVPCIFGAMRPRTHTSAFRHRMRVYGFTAFCSSPHVRRTRGCPSLVTRDYPYAR